jgi:hypothetical protein
VTVDALNAASVGGVGGTVVVGVVCHSDGMADKAAGWSEDAYDVLVRLEGDPSPATLEACRDDHERLVRAPMERLCERLGDVGGFGRAHISGLSTNPVMWQHTWATVWIARRVRITVRFDLDGMEVEGGWTGPAPDQRSRYLEAAAAEESGSELADVVAGLNGRGYEFVGRPLLRTPHGFDPGHPRGDLLRRRALLARMDLGAGEWLHRPEVVERVRTAFDPLVPLAGWFVDYVALNGFSAVTLPGSSDGQHAGAAGPM